MTWQLFDSLAREAGIALPQENPIDAWVVKLSGFVCDLALKHSLLVKVWVALVGV